MLFTIEFWVPKKKNIQIYRIRTPRRFSRVHWPNRRRLFQLGLVAALLKFIEAEHRAEFAQTAVVSQFHPIPKGLVFQVYLGKHGQRHVLVPSGNLLHSYGIWPFYSDFFPLKLVIFHSYVSLPEGVTYSHTISQQGHNVSLASPLGLRLAQWQRLGMAAFMTSAVGSPFSLLRRC